MITIYFSSTDNWKDEKECSTPLEAAKAIEYQLGYDALADANSYAVDSFGTSRATIDGATFDELRKALPTSSIISTKTQDIINTAMTSAKNKNVDDAVTTLSNLLKEVETQSDSVAVKKAILDVEALKPSGDWLADYYGQSAGGSPTRNELALVASAKFWLKYYTTRCCVVFVVLGYYLSVWVCAKVGVQLICCQV